jgi:hypothetical protein
MKKSIFWLILSVLENKIRLLPAKILSTIKRNKINILDFLMNTVNHPPNNDHLSTMTSPNPAQLKLALIFF